MMGSVYERFREIGVYSSVGLAPAHISFLFLAEACVYAVPSVVFGYLLGQGTVKVLRFVFPFTVNETNVDSLCGYLYSQYASYNDESVGGYLYGADADRDTAGSQRPAAVGTAGVVAGTF